MIHVTQGHEKGIGIEVFLKSLLYITKSNAQRITFYCHKNSLLETIETLPHDMFEVKGNQLTVLGKNIKLRLFEERDYQSSTALKLALTCIKGTDILYTLPTSKDQLLLEGENKLGYTEFFRSYYSLEDIAMSFKAGHHITALLTDHIPLSKVSLRLDREFIENKSKLIIDNICRHYFKPDEIIFTGINPHSGEKGKLGYEDQNIIEAKKSLSKSYPDILIRDEVVPADTAHFHLDPTKKQLFIYAFHDQALTVFKKRFGLLAANVTLGLPFQRLSVDHGTAFSLYGKNIADSSGCFHCLNEAILWDSRTN